MITLQPGVPVKNLMIYSSKVRKESISPWNGFPTKKNATNSILPIPVADNILDIGSFTCPRKSPRCVENSGLKKTVVSAQRAQVLWPLKLFLRSGCPDSANIKPRGCEKVGGCQLREFWDTWIFPCQNSLFSTSPQSCVFGDSMAVYERIRSLSSLVPFVKPKNELGQAPFHKNPSSRTNAEKISMTASAFQRSVHRLGWRTLSVATSLTEEPNCLSWHPCCSVLPFGSHRIGNHPRTIHPIICNRVQPGRSQAADPAWLPTSAISELQRGDTPQKNRSCWMYSFFGHKFASREKP